MPVRNEAPWIERSFDRLLAQDYPAEATEIIVADGRSTDETRQIVQRLIERTRRAGGPRVVLIDNPRGIVPTALNASLDVARGDVIVRVDGHSEIAEDHVSRCVQALEATGADNVGGIQRAVGSGLVGRAIAAAMSSPFGVGGARFHYTTEAGWADTVFLGAYRRDVFDRIGRFDEELVRNQDDEFNFRLRQAGGRIWLDPEIVTVYHPRSSFSGFWRQYREYGFYKVLVMRKRKGVASLRHLVPATFVAGGAVLAGLSLVARRPAIIGAYGGAYGVANLTASGVHRGPLGASRVLLPIAFAVMHIAYGVGFLHGVVHWTWRARGR